MADRDQTRVLSFGDAAAAESGLVSLVIDPGHNLDSDGNVKSRFTPGTGVYLLLHLGPDVQLVRMLETSGGLVRIGTVTRKNTVDVSLGYAGSTLELPHYPLSSPNPVWYGRSASLSLSGRTLTVSSGPVRGKLTYSYQAIQYLYKPPAGLTIANDAEFPAVAWAETRKVS